MGKLVFCGSGHWDQLGRKQLSKDFDFPSPHVFGPLSSIDLVGCYTHCTASHAVCIDSAGQVYLFGRNEHGGLGDGSLKASDLVISKMKDIVHAAVGRNHTVLVSSSGQLFGAGENKLMQLGLDNLKDCKSFTQIPVEGHFVKAACGADFTLAITDDGRLYSWGNPQYGQLGHGSTHEYIGSNNRMLYDPQPPKLVEKLRDKNIVDIACGTNHCLALDDTGALYTWGCGGYGRLGLNETPPKDNQVPVEISGFKDRSNPIKKIACGATCRDALYIWGKWKNSGDGGQGTPWLYPKHFQGLSGWTVREISAGNASLFALASTDEEVSTISWGQNAHHGELGHGANKPRSATNAVKVDDLEDFKVLSVSCGLGFTILLVDSGTLNNTEEPKLKDLPTAFEKSEDEENNKKRAAAGSNPPSKKAKGK